MSTKTVIITAVAAATLALTGCANEAKDGHVGYPSGDAAGSAAAHSAPKLSPSPEKSAPTVEDFKLNLTVTSKQCFGSAGCNVQYRVAPVWQHSLPVTLDGDYDLTYKVEGDESGPIIDTLTVYANGKYSVPWEGFASTSYGGQKLTAEIIRIREHVGY
jgi:hypothetical protein